MNNIHNINTRLKRIEKTMKTNKEDEEALRQVEEQMRQWLAPFEYAREHTTKTTTEEESKIIYRGFLIRTADTPERQFLIEHVLNAEEQRLFYQENEEYKRKAAEAKTDHDKPNSLLTPKKRHEDDYAQPQRN